MSSSCARVRLIIPRRVSHSSVATDVSSAWFDFPSLSVRVCGQAENGGRSCGVDEAIRFMREKIMCVGSQKGSRMIV